MNRTYPESNDQEAYWDSVAETKTFPTPFQIDRFKKHVSPDMNILDVGCGYGRTLHELHENNYGNLTGVDFSQRMIDRGSRQYPHLKLLKSNDSVLPFNDRSFDAVILIAVLTCIAHTEDQINLISEILRVLNNDGIIYINDYLLNSDPRNIDRYNLFREKYEEFGVFELPEGAIVRHHTRKHIFDILKGFTQLIYEPMVYTTMNGNKSNGFYYMGKKRSPRNTTA